MNDSKWINIKENNINDFHWIDIKEKYPENNFFEEDSKYLVTIKKPIFNDDGDLETYENIVGTAFYSSFEGFYGGDIDEYDFSDIKDEVTAWMKIPKPFK